MADVREVLRQLDAVSKTSDDGWRASCPVPSHGKERGDQNPSLSVTEGDDGSPVFNCHAGCSFEEIRDALGLDGRDPSTGRETVYTYHNANGKPAFEVVRSSGKKFFQRQPDGTPGRDDVEPVPYHLPEILDADSTVFVTEGEKDVETLRDHDLTTTCNPGGAGNWRDGFTQYLQDKEVVILPDNDDPGREHAREVATSLEGIAEAVRIVELPGLDEGEDITDWFLAGGTVEELRELVEETDPDQVTSGGPTDQGEKGNPTQAQVLVDYALGHFDLFTDRSGTAFASIPSEGHVEHHPVESRTVKDTLGRIFYRSKGKPPTAQAVTDALGILRAEARFEGPTRRVWTRIAKNEGRIYLDLGGPKWRAVEIRRDGSEIVDNPAVVFRRSGTMRPLPEPDPNGDISKLRPLLNADDHETWILTVSFLVAGLRPDYPYPVLALHGEQGSGKSTMAKMLRRLIDPAKPAAKGYVKNERDLLIGARHNHLVNLDNLSGLPVWLSDALCRLATGSGFSTRKLYTDDAEEVFEATRPIVVNGITSLTDRPDLADRAIVLNLPSVPHNERQPEEEVWSKFEEICPAVLGGLLDAVSTALNRIDDVKLETLPRMADFARWVTAAEPALPWEEGQFIEAYRSNREEAVDKTLEANPLAQALLEFMEDRDQWEGMPSDLLHELERVADGRATESDAWPGNASWLSRKLKRPAPFLRKKGVEIDWDPGGRSRSVKISTRNAAYGGLASQRYGKDAKDGKIPTSSEEGLW